MDAGNISNVAKALKDKYPDKLYVIAADNDRFSKVNVGVQEANKVAEDIGAVVIVPEFSQNIGTDYNDLRIYDDISILEKQLQQLLLNWIYLYKIRFNRVIKPDLNHVTINIFYVYNNYLC